MSLNRAERRRRETHQRLVDALRDELAETGLDATTVQAVTDRADVALGTFYNHFDDKDAAIHALAALELAKLRATRASIDGDVERLPRLLSTTVAITVRRAAIDGPWIRCLHALSSGGYWPGRGGGERYLTMITEASEAGDIRPTDPEFGAAVLASLLTTLIEHVALGRAAERPDQAIDDILRTLLGAIGVDPARVDEEVKYALSLPTDQLVGDGVAHLAETD